MTAPGAACPVEAAIAAMYARNPTKVAPPIPPPTPPPPTPPPTPPAYAARDHPNKALGVAVFATRPVARFERLWTEAPLVASSADSGAHPSWAVTEELITRRGKCGGDAAVEALDWLARAGAGLAHGTRLMSAELQAHKADVTRVCKQAGCAPSALLALWSAVAHHTVATQAFATRHITGAAVYANASRVNHSCTPTALLVTRAQDAAVFALRDLAPGDEVTIDYLCDHEWLAPDARAWFAARDIFPGGPCVCASCSARKTSGKTSAREPESWEMAIVRPGTVRVDPSSLPTDGPDAARFDLRIGLADLAPLVVKAADATSRRARRETTREAVVLSQRLAAACDSLGCHQTLLRVLSGVPDTELDECMPERTHAECAAQPGTDARLRDLLAFARKI